MKKNVLLILLSFIIYPVFAGHYTTHTWNYDGQSRQYYLYVPSGYDSTKPAPFVLVLHGLGDQISNFVGIDMNLVADTANFIFAMPQALADPNYFNTTAWNSGAAFVDTSLGLNFHLNANVDDVGFLNAIINSTTSKYNIDSTRLYCTGFSMGGFMTNLMGCALGNRLAAIASVSGTIGIYDTCTSTRVIPACHFHGTADQTVAYVGDAFGSDPEDLVAYWVAHNHCDAVPTIDTLPKVQPDSLTFIHYTYPNGSFGSDVEFYKVINAQHEWIDEPNMNYSVAIWQFFSKFTWSPQTVVNSIEEQTASSEIKVYPNPANDILTIKYTLPDIPAQLFITDFTGRTLLIRDLRQVDNNVNIKDLPDGFYTYRVRNSENAMESKGIIVVLH